jgi:hypothetical protein
VTEAATAELGGAIRSLFEVGVRIQNGATRALLTPPGKIKFFKRADSKPKS